jgi:RimJ/RimL family protein N-acetyltransferase
MVPATAAHARAEIHDREAFARLIAARIPERWPPDSTVDALPLLLKWLEAVPDRVGWFAWYALAREIEAQGPVLVGSAGFLGPPKGGAVEIGYSVLPPYQKRGIATETVGRLVRRAFDESKQLDRIVAETEWSNPESVRVLTKLGFVESGEKRFELSRGRWLIAAQLIDTT